jgi:hypothetical protein
VSGDCDVAEVAVSTSSLRLLVESKIGALKSVTTTKLLRGSQRKDIKMCGPLPPIFYVNVAGPVVGACCGKRSGPAREDVVAKWGPECRYEWLALVLLWTTSRRVLRLFLGVLVAGMRP